MDRGPWWATEGIKELDVTEQLTHFHSTVADPKMNFFLLILSKPIFFFFLLEKYLAVYLF